MGIGRAVATVLIAAGLLGAAGCAALIDLYREDRCWVPDDMYATAREYFIQTGSLDLVRRRMEDMEWKRCQRNEVVYRLQKEFEVLPEALPGTPTPPVIEDFPI